MPPKKRFRLSTTKKKASNKRVVNENQKVDAECTPTLLQLVVLPSLPCPSIIQQTYNILQYNNEESKKDTTISVVVTSETGENESSKNHDYVAIANPPATFCSQSNPIQNEIPSSTCKRKGVNSNMSSPAKKKKIIPVAQKVRGETIPTTSAINPSQLQPFLPASYVVPSSKKRSEMSRSYGLRKTDKRSIPINPSHFETAADTIKARKEFVRGKKALYQRKYLDGVRRRESEAIHVNDQTELLSLEMVYAPSTNQLESVERDPITALMAMATNSGLGRFSGISELMENWQEVAGLRPDEDIPPSYVTELNSQIRENVTEADTGRIVDNFHERFHLDASLLACGSCGQKTYSLGTVHHHPVHLTDLSSLKMSIKELATLLALPAEYRSIASFYKASDGTYFHLHQEFVRVVSDDNGVEVEQTILCHTCYEAVVQHKKLPVHSLAAGMDFGNTDRIDLSALTIPEEYVISKSRLLVSIIKLSGYQQAERQSGKLGHVIVFPQDSKQLEDEIRKSQIQHDQGTYPRLDNLHENISVAFVGSQLQWAALVPYRQAIQRRHVDVRVDVVYRWLRMLKAVNPKYKDIIIDESPEMITSLQLIPQELMDRATIIDHETDIGIDRLIHERSAPGGSMNNEDIEQTETGVEEETGRLPTTYLTRSSRPNISNTSTATALLQGVSAAFPQYDPLDETPSDLTCTNNVSDIEHQTEGSSTVFQNSSTVVNDTDSTINIEQGRDPLNEFEQNDHLLYSCFPHLFPLGRGLRKFGSVPRSDVKHMITQANNKMAECLRFIFVLFDQWQRHEATRVIAATVKSNQASMDAFSELVADPLFLKKIEQAKNHPDDASTKSLMAKVMPHLSLCNSRVPYTVAERKSSVGHLLNLVRFYGTPSIFFTFSPDDTHGTLNLRMALPFTDNWTFPATESGFGQAIREGNQTFQNVTISQSALRTLLARGPVAAAEIFRLLVENVFLNLLGTPPDNCAKKKIVPLPKRPAGVFGTPIAAFGCTEEQARGSLHMHIVFWGGLTPSLLQAAGGVACLQRELTKAIERMVSAELEPATHLRHLIRDLHNIRPAHAALYETHHPIREREEFCKDIERTIDLSNIHQHTHTCYKTKPGERCCRLGRPMHLEEETGSKEIVAVKLDPQRATVSFDELPNIRPPLLSTTRERCYSTMPIAMRDTRLVMHHHRRPLIREPRSSLLEHAPGTSTVEDGLALSNEDQAAFDCLSSEHQEKVVRALVNRNGLVVEYNPICSALLRCNTNASMLGGDAQAKAALAYLLKYVTKPPAELAHSLSVLHHARRTIDLNPSKADDSGTVRRTGMHYLNRIINQLSGAIEISAGMAAAALLGMPAETCSESFWIAFVTAAIAYTRHHPEFHPSDSEESEFADMDSNPFESNDQEERLADDDSIISDDVIMEDEVDNEELILVDQTPEPTASTSAELEEIFNETEPIVFGPEEEQRSSDQTEQLTVSSAAIYKTDGKVVAVPHHVHYAFRGTSLAMLTLYEYVAIIDVVPMIRKARVEDIGTTGPDLGGRASNGTFHFVIQHPLYATHIQRIRSKTKIPILVGPPPQMPAPKPLELIDAWKRQARLCANYYLVLYKPWEVQTSDGGTLPGSMTWHNLCLYMRELECGSENSPPSFLNRIRSKWITNAAHGLRIAGNDRTAAQKYRTQSASVWSKPDGSEPIGIVRSQEENDDVESSGSRRLEEEAAVKAQEAIDLLRGETAADDLLDRSNHRALEFYEATRLALDRIFQPSAAHTTQIPMRVENAREFLQTDSQQSAADISKIASQLKEDVVIPVPDSLSDDEFRATTIPESTTDDEPLPTLANQLNPTQRTIWLAATTYFEELVRFKEGRRTRPEPFAYFFTVVQERANRSWLVAYTKQHAITI